MSGQNEKCNVFAFALHVYLIFSVSGCAYYRQYEYRPAEPLPETWRTYYSYPAASPEPIEEIVAERATYRIRRIEFPVSFPPELMRKSWEEIRAEWAAFSEGEKSKGRDMAYKVRIDFYEIRAEKPAPLVIISPILGGNNQVAKIFAAFFARSGFHAAIVHRQKLKVDRLGGLDQMEWYLRTSVLRARQAVDWLFRQESVDPERVGTFGISFGGIINTFLAATDPRLKAHVVAMAGGNLAQIVVDCPEKSIRPHIETFLTEKGWTKERLQSELHHRLRTDTLPLARYVDGENVLMFVSVFDHVIARKEQRNLWKAFGKPEAVFFPFGHYTSFIVMPYIAYKSLHFLEAKLNGPEPLGNEGIFPSGVYTPE